MSNPYGRPCLPISVRKIIVSATLTPGQRDFVKAYGEGSLTRGIRAMITVCAHLQDLAAKQRLSSDKLDNTVRSRLNDGAAPVQVDIEDLLQHDVFKQQPESE